MCMCGRNRGCHACHPHSVRFRHWAWYEWLTAVFLIVALIYSIYGIISVSIVIDLNQYPIEAKDMKTIVHPTLPMTVLAILLTAHCFLFVTTIIGLLWLKFLRNMCIFLATFVLLVITIIFYFLAGGVLQYTIDNNDGLKEEVFNQIFRNIRLLRYALKFRTYQREHTCCGIYGYRDWIKLSPVDGMTNSPDSVPESCCPTSIFMENCGAGVMNQAPKSTMMASISKRGCFDDLMKEYTPVYRAYAIEVFVIAFLLIGLLILLLYICHRLYLQLVRPRYYGQGEGDGAGGDGYADDTYTANNNQGNMYGTRTEYDVDSSVGPRQPLAEGTGTGTSTVYGPGAGTGVSFAAESGGRKGRNAKSGRSRRGRDRDDDRESYIIPGTPAKSMISDDEQTFYAP